MGSVKTAALALMLAGCATAQQATGRNPVGAGETGAPARAEGFGSGAGASADATGPGSGGGPAAGGIVAARRGEVPTRLILIVGDGVGLPQWSAARLTGGPLALERLPVIGLSDTRCDCDRTTDSGAGATALATGQRTRYRMVGTASDSSAQTSVLEAAEARGLASGLVTTSHITDATPAAFGADRASRYNREGIADDYADKDIEVLLGGGLAFFDTRRPDGHDLLREFAQRYTMVTKPAQFAALDLARTERLLGLFADSTIYPDNARRPTLPAMAEAALTILDRNPRGFFLLLESEDTDEAGHERLTAPELVKTLRELDATVAVALEYQRRNPETLVIVTGDHETGGLAVQVQPDGQVYTSYTTGGHSAESVPVFAGGPGARHFGRWLGNDEVGRLLLQFIEGTLAP